MGFFKEKFVVQRREELGERERVGERERKGRSKGWVGEEGAGAG